MSEHKPPEANEAEAAKDPKLESQPNPRKKNVRKWKKNWPSKIRKKWSRRKKDTSEKPDLVNNTSELNSELPTAAIQSSSEEEVVIERRITRQLLKVSEVGGTDVQPKDVKSKDVQSKVQNPILNVTQCTASSIPAECIEKISDYCKQRLKRVLSTAVQFQRNSRHQRLCSSHFKKALAFEDLDLDSDDSDCTDSIINFKILHYSSNELEEIENLSCEEIEMQQS